MIRDRNRPLPDHHLHLNDLHDFGSSGLSIPSGIDDRSNLHPQGVTANTFGPLQPPAKKTKKEATTAAETGLIPHTNLPRKTIPKQQNVQKTQKKQKKSKDTAAAAVQASQVTKPPQPKKVGVAHTKARARANTLRQQYPGMKNVPPTISKAQRAKFTADYIATLGEPIKKPAEPKPAAKPVAKTVAKVSASRSQRLAVHSTTTAPLGASNRNPIAID